MTEGGISKKMFFGCLVGQQLANMAIAEKDPKLKVWFFVGIWFLIIIFWAKQALLDYMKDIKNDGRTE